MSDTPKPIYRRDGQIHNFLDVPYPGKRGASRRDYDLWLDYTQPEPKRNVGQIDVEDHSKKFGIPIPYDLDPETYLINCLLKHRTHYES